MADVTYCPVCLFETTFPHDHRPDNSGIDDGPPLKTRKKAAPKSPEVMAMIRARACPEHQVVTVASRLARPRFTADDAETAFNAWGMNCGPAAAAAVLGMTLDEIRPHLGDFEQKGYTNPTLMWSILRGAGVRFSFRGGHLGQRNWPVWGLARIQWCGPWTKPGVPARAAYRHTHWVGAWTRQPGDVGIFDVNCLNNGSGWSTLNDWATIAVPWILRECVPKASGDWFITHSVEVCCEWRRANAPDTAWAA